MSKVWIVGQCLAESESGIVWDIQGVFPSEEAAIAACRNDYYFIGPMTLGETLPHERMDAWVGSYYPLAK